MSREAVVAERESGAELRAALVAAERQVSLLSVKLRKASEKLARVEALVPADRRHLLTPHEVRSALAGDRG